VRSTTIRTPSRSAVKAALTSSGLFFILHGRRVPTLPVVLAEQHTPLPRNPATVVYLRWAAIVRRLDEAAPQ